MRGNGVLFQKDNLHARLGKVVRAAGTMDTAADNDNIAFFGKVELGIVRDMGHLNQSFFCFRFGMWRVPRYVARQ
jgi:hypothetical protein